MAADEVLYDKDADLSVLEGKTVAILGYGSQGHAHALNLKDSGVKVVVGLRPDSSSRADAEGEGLEVMDIADAASAGGILLMFAHGFAIRFGQIEPPPGVDVGMVAPKGPGHLVRREFVDGAGVPCLMAIHQDATGTAREQVLAYASGIGGGR